MAYLEGYHEGNRQPPNVIKHNRSLSVCPDIVLPILAMVGIGLICCLFPQVQQWIAHTITYIETGQMTLGSAIALMGLPAIGATCLIVNIVLFVKTHQRRSFETLQDGSFKDIQDTLKSCTSQKSWVIGALTIASLIIAGLAIGHLQPFQNALGYPIRIWQGMAYFGGGGIIGTGLILAMIHGCAKIKCSTKKMAYDVLQNQDIEYQSDLLLNSYHHIELEAAPS